jgi:hypothetical protein
MQIAGAHQALAPKNHGLPPIIEYFTKNWAAKQFFFQP